MPSRPIKFKQVSTSHKVLYLAVPSILVSTRIKWPLQRHASDERAAWQGKLSI